MNDLSQFDLLDALHMMDDVVDDNHGNVSCRIGDVVWIKPSGMEYGKITVQDLVVSSLDGKIVTSNSDRKPSVDLVNHLAIYRNNPNLGAICHTHSPHVVVFAASNLHIPCCTTEQADRFGGDIFCQDFVIDPDSWGKNVVLSDLISGGFSSDAVLLEYHGGLTFASDPVTAVELASHLENVAHKAYLVSAFREYRTMPAAAIKIWNERYKTKYGQ